MVTFHSWGYPLPHPRTPPSPLYKRGRGEGGLSFKNFPKKGKVQIFPTKREGLVKYGGVVLKKAGYHLYLIFKQAFSNAIFCSVCETCVFMSFFAHLNYFYHVFHRLTESNQQLWDFYMGITFEKQRYYGPLQCKCLMSMSDLLSVIQITAVSIITGSVNIYLCLNIDVCVCCV